MKKFVFLALLTVSTGILSSAVLVPQKRAVEQQAAGFIKAETGFKKDLATAD